MIRRIVPALVLVLLVSSCRTDSGEIGFDVDPPADGNADAGQTTGAGSLALAGTSWTVTSVDGRSIGERATVSFFDVDNRLLVSVVDTCAPRSANVSTTADGFIIGDWQIDGDDRCNNRLEGILASGADVEVTISPDELVLERDGHVLRAAHFQSISVNDS